jgi:Na+/H+ antiporter NhaA
MQREVTIVPEKIVANCGLKLELISGGNPVFITGVAVGILIGAVLGFFLSSLIRSETADD